MPVVFNPSYTIVFEQSGATITYTNPEVTDTPAVNTYATNNPISQSTDTPVVNTDITNNPISQLPPTVPEQDSDSDSDSDSESSKENRQKCENDCVFCCQCYANEGVTERVDTEPSKEELYVVCVDGQPMGYTSNREVCNNYMNQLCDEFMENDDAGYTRYYVEEGDDYMEVSGLYRFFIMAYERTLFRVECHKVVQL